MKEISFESNLNTLLDPAIRETQTQEGQEESFGEILMDSINHVNKLQKEANQAIEEMIAGKGRGIHETMIAMEKAGVSFQLMMEVRNKIIAAYQKAMQMA
jgi:flagellar hook-basal body complex protein FliE